MTGRASSNSVRDQHVVKVVFQDTVPTGHMRGLIRHVVSEFGMVAEDECEWCDPEGGIVLTIYPEPADAIPNRAHEYAEDCPCSPCFDERTDRWLEERGRASTSRVVPPLPEATLPNVYTQKGGFGGGSSRSMTPDEHNAWSTRRRWWQLWRSRDA